MSKNDLFVVRRSVDYGSDRKASSYLIEGANGYRFAKCSTSDAEWLPMNRAQKILKNLRRKDYRRDDSTYEILAAI